MKNGAELNERKKQILKAVIEAHISQGEPIGSKYLMQSQKIALSSATIRNEMAELEQMGYLEQPHTSAGRVPSEAGYRFYVNSLMEDYRLTGKELQELNNLVKSKAAELDQILDRAGRLMSSVTNYTSLALRPKQQGRKVRRYKTVLLDSHSFLLSILLEADQVKTQCIHCEEEIDEDMLLRMEQTLNTHLTGIPMEEVTLPVMLKMEQSMGAGSFLISTAVKRIYDALHEGEGDALKLDGVTRLLEYPEYSNAEQLRNMLWTFEDKDSVFDVILNAKNEGVNVYIGSENPLDASHNSSLVFKTISQGERVLGAIGVIGPRRMDYSKVIKTVEYLTQSITEMLLDADTALPPPKED
jgi:heat-inducible transcriptional repressor